MRKAALLLLSALCVLPAGRTYALSMESMDGHATQTLTDLIGDYLEVPDNVLDWKILGATKVIEIDTRDADGMDLVYDKPEFTDVVKKLDGQKVRIKGFMFPLDETDAQTEFLIGPFPSSCPYQYHVGPNLVIEAHADDDPVKFTYDPITLEGTLELVPEDQDYSTFYRLRGAHIVK